jgi:AcrR family transcriptional regulator
VGEDDQPPWPPPRPYPRERAPRSPAASRASREAARDQQIKERVQRHSGSRARPPGRDRGLSRDEIVRAAVAIADAEGPDAISMRRIARELRAGAMSLYWHVGSKEELLDLILDSIEAEIRVPGPTDDWRSDLRALAVSQREVLLRHQWAMEFIAGRPPAGPNVIRNLERMLDLIARPDLDTRVTMNILMTIGTYVTGAVLREAQETRADRDRQQAEATMTKEELAAEQERYHAWIAASGHYPNVQRIMDQDYDPDAPDTRDERFEFGLDCLLDGISTRLRSLR